MNVSTPSGQSPIAEYPQEGDGEFCAAAPLLSPIPDLGPVTHAQWKKQKIEEKRRKLHHVTYIALFDFVPLFLAVVAMVRIHHWLPTSSVGCQAIIKNPHILQFMPPVLHTNITTWFSIPTHHIPHFSSLSSQQIIGDNAAPPYRDVEEYRRLGFYIDAPIQTGANLKNRGFF